MPLIKKKKITVFLLSKLQVLANSLLETLAVCQLTAIMSDHVKKKIFNFSLKSELVIWAKFNIFDIATH